MELLERRSSETEIRFVATEGTKGVGTLSGYAAVFNSMSTELGTASRRFRERIAPGAFRAALEAGTNVFAFYHHGIAGGGGPFSAMPLASTRDGSLRLKEDAHGLGFELDLPDTTEGRDLAVISARGTVRGVSFSFPPGGAKDTWQQEGGVMVRTLHEVRRLLDISPTHMPAYQDTAFALRSLCAWEATETRAFTVGGELSYEHKHRAIDGVLRRLLGDPWTPGVERWEVTATFDGAVIVQRSGQFQSYPVTWAGTEPRLGEPTPVDQVYQPADDAARRRRRVKIAEAS